MSGVRRVRAVVVTWQGAHLLPSCLESLLAQDAEVDLEVLVVDNASTDGTAELLAARFPQVAVRVSPENRGFAGGVALGTADWDGDAVLLLNNDATLEPDALRHLVRVLDENPEVGAVTAKILLAGWYRPLRPAEPEPPGALHRGPTALVPAGPEERGAVRLVNSTGNVWTPWGAGVDRDWLAEDGRETGGVDVEGFCGGAALLRTRALHEAGGFDPDLFLYYEDTDVSARMRAAGWTVRYAAAAVAHHRHAATSDVTSPLFRYQNTRNSLVVAGRHAPGPVVLRSWARQTAGLLRAVVTAAEPAPLLAARARGLRDAVRALPGTLRERRRTWSGPGRAPGRPPAPRTR